MPPPSTPVSNFYMGCCATILLFYHLIWLRGVSLVLGMPKGICLFYTVNRAKKSSKKPSAVWKNDSLMWLESCEKKDPRISHTWIGKSEESFSIFDKADFRFHMTHSLRLRLTDLGMETQHQSFILVCAATFSLSIWGGIWEQKSDIWERIYFHPKCQLHIYSTDIYQDKDSFLIPPPLLSSCRQIEMVISPMQVSVFALV